MRSLYKTRFFLLLLATLASAAIAATHTAAEELRWKFKPGDKLNYSIVQDSTMSAEASPVGQMNMRQEMDMQWDVAGVNEQGEAVIQQKFDRVKMKMTLPPPVGGIEYDSKSEEPATGVAAMLAPMIKAISEGVFEITITPRGEVKDVKIPEDVLNTLKNNPSAMALGEMASEEGFKKMLSQGVQLLPEQAKEGEQWSSKFVLTNPAAGKQTVETIYRFEGTRDVDGTKMAVIRPELKLSIDSNPDAGAPTQKPDEPQQPQQPQPTQIKMNMKEQKSEGEVLFDIEAGRLASSKLHYTATIEVSIPGQTVQQKIDQKASVTLKPAGEQPETEETEKSAGADEAETK